MKIVILEADSLGQDMVFTPFEALGEVVIYPTTTADEMEEKTKDADVIVANKVPICFIKYRFLRENAIPKI